MTVLCVFLQMTTIQGSLETTSPGGPVKSRFPLTMEQIKFVSKRLIGVHVLHNNCIEPQVQISVKQ